MAKSVKLLKEAETEFWKSVTHYEESEPGFGLDFEQEIRNALQFIMAG